MKLLTKLTVRYVLFSLAAMAVSGIAIYFVLGHIINYQMDERLNENLRQVENQMRKTPDAVFYDPYIKFTAVENNSSAKILSDTLVYNEQEDEYEECRKLSAVISAGDKFYKVEILKSKIESEDLQLTLALVTILVMLLLTGTLIYANRLVAKSIWKPFYENLELIRQFSLSGEKPIVLNKSGILEFEQLNQVLEKLTEKIISDFQNQKQFSEDISHELQTPLAIITSQIEALLNDNELQEKHSEKLNSIFNSVQRLTKINKSIILLSKIENNQFYSDEETNLTQLITEKLEEFSELIKLKKLTLETELHNDLIVPIPQTLAEVLLNNLISNSINHNIKGGKIKIEILKNQLKICNSGLTEINQPERIFARFYKGDPSSTSVGLGLAIVKKICDLYHINIEYHFNESSHCFALHC